MEINKIASLSASESATKPKPSFGETIPEQKQQAEFVSSHASQASRAYATAKISNSKTVSFEGKYEKIYETIKNATSPSKVHLSFDEVSTFLERLGYKVDPGKGSHCTVNIPNARPLTIVRPHGDHKYVDPGTIKDLRALINK